LYDHVKAHRETLDIVEKLENELMIRIGDGKDIDDYLWAYERLIKYYYRYLGKARDDILEKCSDVKTVLENEKREFS
jgi:hypothetical protein